MRIRERFALLAISMSGVLLSGCFAMQPVQNVTPASGAAIAIDLNDAGRTALEPTMGRDIGQIHGNLVRQDSDSYQVAVTSVDFVRGGSQSWTGEVVPIKTAYTGTLYTQVFSVRRTAMVGAAIVVAAAVMAKQGLETGSAPITTGDNPPPPDSKQRSVPGLKIPLRPATALRVVHHLWSALALKF